MAKPKPFRTEEELCAAFAPVARAAGWDVHSEVNGTDMLLVATATCSTEQLEARGTGAPGRCVVAPGTQLVVEAKLRGNFDVLVQALPPDPYRRNAADFYAALVPTAPSGFRAVASRCGVNTIEAARWDGWNEKWVLNPQLDFLNYRHVRTPGQKPRWVPPVLVEAPAGQPSPRSLTPWKLAAVRLCLEFEGRDIHASDFKAAGIDMKRWRDHGWLVNTGRKAGRKATYRLCGPDHTPKRPDMDYPEIAAALQVSPPLEELHERT